MASKRASLQTLWPDRCPRAGTKEVSASPVPYHDALQSARRLLAPTDGRHPLAGTVGLVEKVIAVAQRLLAYCLDRNGDRLDVLIAVILSR
jgi:hypothetical protein